MRSLRTGLYLVTCFAADAYRALSGLSFHRGSPRAGALPGVTLSRSDGPGSAPGHHPFALLVVQQLESGRLPFDWLGLINEGIRSSHRP